MSKSIVPGFELVDCSSGNFIKLDCSQVCVCASNKGYDTRRGDGRTMVYFPVQCKDGAVRVRAIDLSNLGTPFENVMDVVLSDGTKTMSIAGCKLDDNGCLWICVVDKNMLIGCDLVSRSITTEIKESIVSPRDVCFSEQDPTILYVVGGSTAVDYSPFMYRSIGEQTVLPVIGQIYHVNASTKAVNIVLTNGGLRSPAGIASARDKKLCVSQLYELREVDLNAVGQDKRVGESSDRSSTDHRLTAVAWNAEVADDCYLMDKISRWDDNMFVGALYRRMDKVESRRMKTSVAKRKDSLFSFCLGPSTKSQVAIVAAEKSTADHCTFVVFHANSPQQRHLMSFPVIHIPHSRATKDFDGHCTQVLRHGGKLVFVCCKSSSVLVMDDVHVDAAVASGSASSSSAKGAVADGGGGAGNEVKVKAARAAEFKSMRKMDGQTRRVKPGDDTRDPATLPVLGVPRAKSGLTHPAVGDGAGGVPGGGGGGSKVAALADYT